MKKYLILIATIMSICSASAQDKDKMPVRNGDTTDKTQDFYDNAPTYSLEMTGLIIEGEIDNPGPVDFSKLTKRSVMVKEALLNKDGTNRFTGAYRYDGYSLYDILNTVKLNKKNAKEFKPIIDLYLEISNNKGEKVVVSWGEVYYPNTAHRILITSDVARIVPSKTKELWELPVQSKLVFANDLLTERNISMPTRIKICSYSRQFPVDEKHEKMFSPGIRIYNEEKEVRYIENSPQNLTYYLFNNIFYGRGKGIHSTTPFKGPLLKDVISGISPINSKQLKQGFIGVAAEDGYRVVISISELYNRNDQQEFLLIETRDDKDGGVFRIFPACDFFSDRAVKAIKSIYFERIKD